MAIRKFGKLGYSYLVDQVEVRRLFLRALEILPEQQPAFLESTGCSSETREAVLTLLHHDSGTETMLDQVVARERDAAVSGNRFGVREVREVLGNKLRPSGSPQQPEEGVETRIGKYEIHNEIGRGGFGQVYRAYDPSVRRPVAIKVLTSEGDPDLLARFRAEAGMTGKLQHKNIVTVFDCGEQNGSPYFVMEYLEGENLQTILRNKKSLGLLEKMRIICQIAEGLHYAHQSGVIHRDIKPANIMLLPTGVVKIMDFGIARLVDIGPTRRTRSGDLIGTTSYMSPEQFRGSDADARSDIFAFGLICYELLSGVHPFQAADVSAVIYRIMSVEPLPLREVFADCPEPLESLVHRALAKDRERRYSSLDDVLIDAEPIILELRRDQAAHFMTEVNAFIGAGEYEKAQMKLKQALELDPLNREARKVKVTLQEERNRRLLEQNIQALEREANTKLSTRAFPEALQVFENALRLSPNDSRLKSLVEDTRAKVHGTREAGRLLSEAKLEAQNERFLQAKELASQALSADPEHPEAPPLIKHLDDEIERIEKLNRFRAGIDESERLLLAGEYDRAMQNLQSLAPPNSGALLIADLQNRIRSRQMEDYRRKRAAWLESELSKAKQLQGEGAYPQALEVLDSLLADFPDFGAIEVLRKAVHDEIGAQQRAANLGNLMQSARNLIWNRQLSEAVASLEDGLKTFPGDAGIRQLLEAAKALNGDESRQRSLAEIASQARTLRNQNRLEEALALLKNGLKTHGSDTVLADMGRIATLEQESRRAFDRLQRYRTAISDLLAAGSIPEALTTLGEACSTYPMDPTLEMLSATAEERYAQANEQELVTAVLRTSSEREKAGDLAGALDEISKELQRIPGSKDLQTAAAELTARIQSADRENRIQALAQEIRRSMDSRDWAHATTMATSARRDYPDQIVFDELAGQIQSRQRTAEVEKAMAGVRESLKTGNLEAVAILLAQLEPAYGSDEIWKAEKKNLERRLDVLARLRKAEGLHKSGNYEEAETILQQLTQDDPSNEQAAGMLKQVTSALLLTNPEEVLRSKMAAAEKLASEGNLPAAAKLLTKLSEQFPNDRGVRDVLEKVRLQLTSTSGTSGTGEASRIKRRVRFAEALLSATKERPPARICTKCNVLLPEGARFCDTCGNPVS